MKDWITVTATDGRPVDLRASAIVKVYETFAGAENGKTVTNIVSGGAPAPLVVQETLKAVRNLIMNADQH